MTDPKAPKFLQSHIDKLNEMWKQANNGAENRLKQLKGMYVFRRCMSGCQLAITSFKKTSLVLVLFCHLFSTSHCILPLSCAT